MAITSTVLLKLKQQWEKSGLTEDTITIWVACLQVMQNHYHCYQPLRNKKEIMLKMVRMHV